MSKVEFYKQHYRALLAMDALPTKRIDYSDIEIRPQPGPPRSYAEWKARRQAKQSGSVVNMATVEPVKPAADPGLLSADERRREIMLAAIRDKSIRSYSDWKRLNQSLTGGAA